MENFIFCAVFQPFIQLVLLVTSNNLINLFASLSDIIVCYYHRTLLNYYYLMSLR